MKFLLQIITFFLISLRLMANEPSPSSPFVEKVVHTEHRMTLNGKPLLYTATAGNMILNKDDKPRASIFYVAYRKKDVENPVNRPITFCFNGGPGAASVWLHMGGFGPKRVSVQDLKQTSPPYTYENNPYTILDLTDLVFVDPISTGFSRPAPGVEAKEFYSAKEDQSILVEFIKTYITRNNLWEVPKYLMGESYGTYRIAGMASLLNDTYRINLNGLIFISTCLNMQTLSDPYNGNDLPYLLSLPSYTATAWLYNKLPKDLQKDQNAAIKETITFCEKEYTAALFRGDALTPQQLQDMANKISRLTGLSDSYVSRENLRIRPEEFTKELLKKENQIVGRFDARFSGPDPQTESYPGTYDPSFEAITGKITSIIHAYLRNELNWKSDETYDALNSKPASQWSFSAYSRSFPTVSHNVKSVMTKNPTLKVFAACGLYDLAIPFYVTPYTMDHLYLEPKLRSNIETHIYDGGHMMYLDPIVAKQLKTDLTHYFK